MARKKDDQAAPADALDFEQALSELESIIDRIEQGEIGLEETIRQYRRGSSLVGRCRTILDAAQQEVEKMTAEELEARAKGESGGECEGMGEE